MSNLEEISSTKFEETKSDILESARNFSGQYNLCDS